MCRYMSTAVFIMSLFYIYVFVAIINVTDSKTSVTALSRLKHKTCYSYVSKFLSHAIRIE